MQFALFPLRVAQPSGFDSRHCVAAAGTFATVVGFASNLLYSSASIFGPYRFSVPIEAIETNIAL
jgi:hypothetical protein